MKTSSGATAVQIVEKRGGVRRILEHVGSAHDEAELAVLMQAARESLNTGQGELDLGLDAPEQAPASRARVLATSSQILWDVLDDAYRLLGFDAIGDDAFRALVLARIIEPTSKADTVRVLEEIGVAAPHVNTLHAALRRCAGRDYRGQVARACLAHSSRTTGQAAMVLYDTTTLHFENDDEDDLRRVGMSKERRVDPQILVGMLVTPDGFPLEVHEFPGNTGETLTLLPVLRAFQDRHAVDDVVVVADAGMLSASNLNQIEDAGFSFIVGSRISKAPYDLAEHFDAHGGVLHDGETMESKRIMGVRENARQRRVVYHYSAKRDRRDNHTLDKQVERAQKIADGTKPLKKDRFVKLTGTRPAVDQVLVDRARQLAGLKGYVTNIPQVRLTGNEIVAAYHELFQVEASFRMAKTDLRARPMFHHEADSIHAHLTIVFTALAISRHLQDLTGASVRKIVRTLRPLRDVTISINGNEIVAKTPPGDTAQAILDAVAASVTH